MVGRPRTVSDSDILVGAARAVNQHGPAGLTLATVATEVGLAPATLVQRFGSKRGLLLALTRRSVTMAPQQFAAAYARGDAALTTLLDVLVEMTSPIRTPDELANNLAFLQFDLVDPEFHRYARDHARVMRAEIWTLLDIAVELGELVDTDTAKLARSIHVAYNGSLVAWAIDRDGNLADYLRDDLEATLLPYRRVRLGPDLLPRP